MNIHLTTLILLLPISVALGQTNEETVEWLNSVAPGTGYSYTQKNMLDISEKTSGEITGFELMKDGRLLIHEYREVKTRKRGNNRSETRVRIRYTAELSSLNATVRLKKTRGKSGTVADEIFDWELEEGEYPVSLTLQGEAKSVVAKVLGSFVTSGDSYQDPNREVIDDELLGSDLELYIGEPQLAARISNALEHLIRQNGGDDTPEPF